MKSIPLSVAAIACLLLVATGTSKARPQPPPSKTCSSQGLTKCPTQDPFKIPTITNDSDYTYITTTACPPYANPHWTNPSEACIFTKTYKIPRQTKMAAMAIPLAEILTVYDNITYLKEDPKPLLGAVGVMLNGVDIFGVGSPCGYNSKCPQDGGPSKWVDAVEAEGHTMDECGGHAAPTHQYHIHSGVGIMTNAGRSSCQLKEDVVGSHSPLLGWLFDGFGLYGAYSVNGSLPLDLDECGGHTHKIDGIEKYHYHLPSIPRYPWIVGCYKGCPEISNNPNELHFSLESPYNCPRGH